MAIENNPNDSFDRDHLRDPTRTTIIEGRSPAEIDNDLQVDPEMAEGPASNSRIALFAVGIAVVLGVVFYGLNHSSMQQQASSVPTPANNQSSSTALPAAPPGMRDVTPRTNTEPGTTTGAAPANPQAQSPASTAPGGANTNLANPSNAKQ
jgi:hypothetical protein